MDSHTRSTEQMVRSEPLSQEEILSKITINLSSSVPLYLQLRNRIAYLIFSGIFNEGDKLPTVRELAIALGINYNTVNRAYMDLEKDGYIVSRRRRGTVVARPLSEVIERDDVMETMDRLVGELISQADELGVPRDSLIDIVAAYVDCH